MFVFLRSKNNTVVSFAPQEFGSEGSGAACNRGDDGADDDVKKPPGFGRLLVRKRQGIVYFSFQGMPRISRLMGHIDPWTPLACLGAHEAARARIATRMRLPMTSVLVVAAA